MKSKNVLSSDKVSKHRDSQEGGSSVEASFPVVIIEEIDNQDSKVEVWKMGGFTDPSENSGL